MAQTPLSDEHELLERLRQGDHVAFTRLYGHYWKPMLLVAWNHTKDKELAEDIVHEVFMALWEKRDMQQIDSVAGFLTTAVKFSIFKYYQKEQRRRELDRAQAAPVASVDDESMLDARFLSEYLAGVVEELPEKCRIVFQYSREKGLKNAEIAQLLQVSEKAVEANLTRALKTLRKRIQEGGFLSFLAVGREFLRKINFRYRVNAVSPYPTYKEYGIRWNKNGYHDSSRPMAAGRSALPSGTNCSLGTVPIATWMPNTPTARTRQCFVCLAVCFVIRGIRNRALYLG